MRDNIYRGVFSGKERKLMQLIIGIIIIILVLSFLSTIWPVLVFFALLFAAWKLYETHYYKSAAFVDIRNRIADYTDDCNKLNEHIEDLKNTSLISDRTDYGDSSYYDSSKWDYKRKYMQNQRYAPYVHNCSRTVCDNASKKPFEYICKYFGIKATEENLENFEAILNNFEAAEEGKLHLQDEKKQIMDSIQNDIPPLIKKFSKNRLDRELGFEQIDLSTAYFPKYEFRYVSSGGNASTHCDVVMDISNLNKFVIFLSKKIKFNKSVAGQRALMTSKLRQHIKERDGYTCKICGASVKQEPNLLLEIDHIIPVSKGGLTTEDNLQTLCWRCNRKKGAKI